MATKRIFLPPVASQKTYVLSITDKVKEIWLNQSQARQQVARNGPFVDQYVWDLHGLSELISDKSQAGFRVVDKDDEFWAQLWVEKYNDNAGTDYIEPLKTFFTVAPFNHITGSKQVYKVEISYCPLITNGAQDVSGAIVATPETLNGEKILYKSIVFPSYPLLFATSIKNHSHYGPIFVASMRLSVGGENQMSPVVINFSGIGGKAVLCPSQPVTPFDLEVNTLTDKPVGDLFDPSAKNPNASTSLSSNATNSPRDSDGDQTVDDYKRYRTCMLYDCLVDLNVYADKDTFVKVMEQKRKLEIQKPAQRIVSMELSMSQVVNFTATSPKTPRSVDQGPRFVSITGRKVEGSITYFSHEEKFDIPKSSGLTMFFGSVYYFPMDNVDWNNPSLEAEATRGGYLHTFNFVARAANNAVTNGFTPSAYGMPVSEFAIGTVIDHAPT